MFLVAISQEFMQNFPLFSIEVVYGPFLVEAKVYFPLNS